MFKINRARYYNPGSGRFLSEDPIGFKSGDYNLFRYVANNSLILNDPSGQIINNIFATSMPISVKLNNLYKELDAAPHINLSIIDQDFVGSYGEADGEFTPISSTSGIIEISLYKAFDVKYGGIPNLHNTYIHELQHAYDHFLGAPRANHPDDFMQDVHSDDEAGYLCSPY